MIIGVVLFFAILLFKNIVTSIIENTLSVTGLGKYTYYLEEGKEESKLESGIGFVYQIIIMSMILYYEKRQDRKDGLIFKITALFFSFRSVRFYRSTYCSDRYVFASVNDRNLSTDDSYDQ